MVSGTNCPDGNFTEPRGFASPNDIAKNMTDPETKAISHAKGTDTGNAGGCDPSAKRNVPRATNRNQVIDKVAKVFLT